MFYRVIDKGKKLLSGTVVEWMFAGYHWKRRRVDVETTRELLAGDVDFEKPRVDELRRNSEFLVLDVSNAHLQYHFLDNSLLFWRQRDHGIMSQMVFILSIFPQKHFFSGDSKNLSSVNELVHGFPRSTAKMTWQTNTMGWMDDRCVNGLEG